MKLIDFFDRGASLGPEHPCLIDDLGVRSYAQVQAMTHRVANACLHDGIDIGTKVAVYSPNQSRAFEALLGCMRAGCAWVPVNARAALDEVVHTLELTDTELLLYSASLGHEVAEIARRCPALRRYVCIDADGLARVPALPIGHLRLDQWLDGMAETSPERDYDDDALAALFCTGGTTGLPKAVMTSHRIWEARISATLLRIPSNERPVQLIAAPMTHAAGAGALELMVRGSTTVILPGFDPERVIRAIGQHRVTHLFLPPTAIYRLLAHPQVGQGDYSSLRYFTYAAAPMSVDRLKEAITIFGPVMEQGYGGTELGTSACTLQPADHVQALAEGNDLRLTSCGRATPLTRLEIMDDEGRLLPAGTMGEIVVRSHCTASGYYKNPEETARAFAGGWYHSGDIGFKDAEGWVYLRDRKKDLIISGGFNVYPSEVERVLMSHPLVQDCAVVGVPHGDWGEAVTAVVECKAGASVGADALIDWAKQKLSNYKVPKSVEFRELPRSPVGKVLKRVIRDAYWKNAGRSI
ncbi:MAG TPA: AMP-binding protein [Variovorax sp.]|nr:AMP-binding protein [Variovorax sp.]